SPSWSGQTSLGIGPLAGRPATRSEGPQAEYAPPPRGKSSQGSDSWHGGALAGRLSRASPSDLADRRRTVCLSRLQLPQSQQRCFASTHAFVRVSDFW